MAVTLLLRVAPATLCLLGVFFACSSYDEKLLKFRTPAAVDDPVVVGECGDGRVDEGELCDEGILEGKEGACPTECTTEDSCEPQVIAGNHCQTQCVGVRIVKAWSDDACCPPDVGPAEDSDCGSCGDGIVGPAETCDPPERCLTREQCTMGISCIFGVFSGDPAHCTAACNQGVAKDCKNGDQCCPAGCNGQNDDDCSATCGDGNVDPGETCEPTAPESPCPVDCDDGIACTEDFIAGSPSNCNVQCANLEIQQPINGDGCCPKPAAHALNDTDCQPVCGNAVKEGSEACDPCPSDCNDSDPCTTDSLAGSPSTCSVVCSHATITQAMAGDGCCPGGANSTTDSDCQPACGNGIREGSEACDGGSLCSSNCTSRFHASLQHRYSFDGLVNSTNAVDAINGDDGTVTNDTLDGDGKITLAGGTSHDYVNLPNRLLSVLTNVTVEAWVKWSGGANNQCIFDFGMSSAGEGSQGYGTSYLFLSPKNVNGKFGAIFNATSASNDTGSSTVVETSSALSTGSMHHVAVTFEDPGGSSKKTMKVYLDGALVAGGANNVTSTASGTANTLANIDDRNVWIGRANYSVDDFGGVVYEFRIYSNALSAAEIQASYAAGPDPAP
jgi:hypothetical protein